MLLALTLCIKHKGVRAFLTTNIINYPAFPEEVLLIKLLIKKNKAASKQQKKPKKQTNPPNQRTPLTNEDLDLGLHSIFTSFTVLESFAGLKPVPGTSPCHDCWQRNNYLTCLPLLF